MSGPVGTKRWCLCFLLPKAAFVSVCLGLWDQSNCFVSFNFGAKSSLCFLCSKPFRKTNPILRAVISLFGRKFQEAQHAKDSCQGAAPSEKLCHILALKKRGIYYLLYRTGTLRGHTDATFISASLGLFITAALAYRVTLDWCAIAAGSGCRGGTAAGAAGAGRATTVYGVSGSTTHASEVKVSKQMQTTHVLTTHQH